MLQLLQQIAGSFFQLLRLGGAAAAQTQQQRQPAASVAGSAAGFASTSANTSSPQEEGFFFSLLPRVSETTFNATAAVHRALASACSEFIAAAVALSPLPVSLVEVSLIQTIVGLFSVSVSLSLVSQSVFLLRSLAAGLLLVYLQCV